MIFSVGKLLGLSCLAANMMLASSDCTVKQGKEDFKWASISGTWYIRIANKVVFDAYNHVIFNNEVLEDKVLAKGTVRQLPSAGGSTLSFDGEWKIPQDHSSKLVPSFSETLAMFNGIYNVLSADSECYYIVQGCPNFVNEQAVAIYFRDEHPTDECQRKAKNALKEAGINEDLVEVDPTFS